MKRILFLLVLLMTTIVFSQQKTFEKEVRKVSQQIEIITKTQKDSLKVKVVTIDKRLEKGEITKTTADTLKKEVAIYHARRIEKLVGEQERLLQLLVQDKTNGKIASSEETSAIDEEATFSIGNKTYRLNINEKSLEERQEKRSKTRKSRWAQKNKKQRSTTSQFVFAMGVNNVLNNHELHSLSSSEYKFWGSHFYEVGLTWKTRFSKQPSQLYIKYGLSFLWNNLRPKNNQSHIVNGNLTTLATRIDEVLSESRLRHVQMNFPVHLEWDLSKDRIYDDGFLKDQRNKSLRIGLGGFVGFKLGTRQYLEFVDIDGVSITELQKDNFNMNTINYGLSAYVGYRSSSFYVKYDMNSLFKNTETRNISLGLRFDLE